MPQTEFSLEAYLSRINVRSGEPASLDLLREIIARHTATIPFENLDIFLGRPIRLDIASIQTKLVETHRGGYCFEQNTLLRAALEHIGFTVSSRMARVVLGASADAITPRTHMLLHVDLPEGPHLADVGFGHVTPTAPLMLETGIEQRTSHEAYRLQPVNGETLLQVRRGTEWQNVYRFSDQPSHPIDHEVASWFTSTHPGNLFTSNLIVARPALHSRKTFLNGAITIRELNQGSERLTLQSEEELHVALHEHFDIDLDLHEVATIFAVMRRFINRPDVGFRFD